MDDILRHKIANRPSKLLHYIDQSADMYEFIPMDAVSKKPPPKAPKPAKDKKAQPVKPMTPPPPSIPERPAVFPDTEQAGSAPEVNRLDNRVSRVPNVEELKIHELGEWMKELKLEKYVGVFAEQGIDGVLLKELSRQDLKTEFGMSSVEAIKLNKFALTGHVPS